MKKLSVKAQEYLEKLRSEHDDMDFVIAGLEHGDSAEEIFSKCKRPVKRRKNYEFKKTG